MSSLKNAVKRRTHKERSQPARRKRFGLLEKKKDYVLRAQDYHNKRARLHVLQQKAAFRNPDEFYFGMINAKTKDGIHRKKQDGAHSIPIEELKLIRSQNAAYLQDLRNKEAAQIEKLQQNLHFIGETSVACNQHTLFLDSEEEARNFDKAEYFNTVPEFEERVYNRPTKEMLLNSKSLVLVHTRGKGKRVEGEDEFTEVEGALELAAKRREKAYKHLYKRVERQKRIDNVLAHVNLHKQLNSKGRRVKVKDAEDSKPPVYRWKLERNK